MGKLRIAVATNENNGLGDVVSNVFGRARTFTIVDAEDEKITGVTILENSAVSYHHGAGNRSKLTFLKLLYNPFKLSMKCDWNHDKIPHKNPP